MDPSKEKQVKGEVEHVAVCQLARRDRSGAERFPVSVHCRFSVKGTVEQVNSTDLKKRQKEVKIRAGRMVRWAVGERGCVRTNHI